MPHEAHALIDIDGFDKTGAAMGTLRSGAQVSQTRLARGQIKTYRNSRAGGADHHVLQAGNAS